MADGEIDSLYLGLDVGTSALKAAVFDASWDVVSSGRAATPWRGSEIDPDALLRAALEAIAEALGGRRVAGIGVAGMAETGVLTGEDLRPVVPSIGWWDERGAEEAERIAAELPDFAERTGQPPSSMCTLAKYAWMRRHWPGAARGTRWFNVAEWIVLGLGGEPGAEADALALDGDERRLSAEDRSGLTIPSPSESDAEEGDADTTLIAPDAYSHLEALRTRDFDRMSPAELREAERLVDLLEPRLELRRTRRYELHHHGRVLAPRAMFRRNLATGGQLTEWVWRRTIRRPRKIVVLCDISGSMERHSRLLLRFIQALSASSAVKTESFVFGTKLTRVTRLLRDRDRDRALANVAEAVSDWAGGTRIGESFRDFNLHWARRTLRSSGVVIVVSDGWDRGDPQLVATETARLRRNCHRLVWLNPLAGTPGYEPLAGGMRAAFPYIDDFLPAGTVASLERLGEILAGVRSSDLTRGGEAAASADAGARAGTLVRDLGAATPLAAGRVAANDARPLR
jgi:uncharacterized protein with von Willebrand factor type A (vWA) domain